ncbi:3-hydroxyacyl-ACP dehydratase FabZ family protein [Streptomyces sp. NL15-2K]|uniref:3-hydroxyacyl-ACP dehydratase FabZ family protein n=1 Tax=Streptomyces sp. NL15-2K TaxID=376149 RepID=UPI000F57BD45|nr:MULTISPECIES: 3-hydroxyacyl-ACP dehydratase FabZ family protein [Actinomycetes]WKX12808.1 3-hydroxyacyl-ACP dehydratase FabZ family protein [Kutzneria buriramensis]GCB45886.1 3-hydroxyacyl-[acyl-carrier-protein] dehydratase [Streptomyces sp. NL15-2K]
MTAPAPALPRVTDLLPHRYPMLLVDRVTELVPGERIRTLKAVTLNEPWYAAIPPDAAPGTAYDYPQSLLVESWGQSAGLLASAVAEAPSGQVMLFGSVADAEFHLPVLPGDVIEHRVRVSRALTDSVIFEGSSHRGDETVMTVTRMVMAFRPADRLRPGDPAEPAPPPPTAAPGREAIR